MNYLAHARLSFNDANLLTGNMISDFVKGKKQFDYPARITAGIQLHRAIDEFTDLHSATQEIKKLFRPAYRLYAGAFADVVYDYFLANDETEFSDQKALKNFTQHTYQMLFAQQIYFPEKFAAMFPHMHTHDWLYHYRFDEGMQKSFGGVARRAKYIDETETAYGIFLDNKSLIRSCYREFYPSLKDFAFNKSAQLLQK